MSGSARPVVVTRSEAPDGPLSRELRALGLEVLAWPAVSVAAPDPGALEAALAELCSYGWLVFASRRAVAAVLDRVPQPPPGVRIAAVGRATALTLRQRGWPVDLVPEEASAGALVTAFATQWKPEDAGVRVLYPASSRALPTIAAGLRQLGAAVTQVEAYRTETGTLDVAGCRALIERGELGAVTFASPSAVSELARALGERDFARLLDRAPPVAIGRTTARELAARGRTAAIAETATLAGLALTTYRLLQARAETRA
ncbi:MAG TPA: uroporphyrinogen-III synthase [Steroidobacteraceae bacterium]|nr:uroporphyrinogen-III synthase [Steroidobacteraceae bacterium]